MQSLESLPVASACPGGSLALTHLFFKLVGALLALYILQCIASGSVRVRAGLGSRTYEREMAPGRFSVAIVIYGLLCLALVTVF